MAKPNDADWSWLRAAAEAPEMTLEVYESLPEDLARGIEVVDGTVIVCHSPSDKHQAVQHALLNALSEAARKHDQGKGTCHRVRSGIDVLLTEVPFHFRTPDLTVLRCLDNDRGGRWKGKPRAADALIVVEVVSPGSRSEDTLVKRVRYARAALSATGSSGSSRTTAPRIPLSCCGLSRMARTRLSRSPSGRKTSSPSTRSTPSR